MSAQLIKGLVAAIAIGGAVINSHVAWSNTAEPAVGDRAYVTPAEFDQTFAAAAAAHGKHTRQSREAAQCRLETSECADRQQIG